MFTNLDVDNIVRNVGPLFLFGLILGFFLGWFLGRARLLPTILLVAFLFVTVGGFVGSRGERLAQAFGRIFQSGSKAIADSRKRGTATTGDTSAGNRNSILSGDGGAVRGNAEPSSSATNRATPTWNAAGFNLVLGSREYHQQKHADFDLRGVSAPILQRDGWLVTLDVQRNGAPDEIHLLWRRYFDSAKAYWRPRELGREEAIRRILGMRPAPSS